MTRSRFKSDWILPVLALVALAVWAWQRLDFFETSRLVMTADGRTVRMPNALATVDHPFHSARFGMFLDALGNGHVPHWVFSHQGGYPAEFYPFGSSLVDLAVWCATLGQMSVPMIHTWAVAIVFVLPALGFLGIARLAGLPLWIAPVGLACHLCIRGWWWSGGSYELIEWGLVTNVLAAALTFLAAISVAAGLSRRNPRWLIVGAGLIAWAEFTNPRSLIAIGTIAAAALIVWLVDRREAGLGFAWLIVPFALGLAGSAPLLFSLIRYDGLYYFVHYSGYANLREWLDSSIQAVSGPIFIAALVGLAITLVGQRSPVESMIGWTTVIYCALTAYLVVIDWPSTWAEQLETTRLMPFQRLLMIALAAIAVGRISLWAAGRWADIPCAAIAALIPILYVISPPSIIPESDHGLVRVPTMAAPGIVDLHAAVEQADDQAPPGTAILILGTTVSWHDQMWATLWSDRLFFYDDWLWYWQREHVGDYDPETEHAYRVDSSTIDQSYLATHGIGAIIVTGGARQSAAEASFLTPIRTGIYDAYLVNGGTTLATIDGSNLASEIDDETIRVSGIQAGGTVTIRENWFPRWQASVDGKAVPVIHRSDGYMDITVPAGGARLTVTYAATALDWIARAVALVSFVVGVAILVRATPTARSELR
jgi:hypothetical protein